MNLYAYISRRGGLLSNLYIYFFVQCNRLCFESVQHTAGTGLSRPLLPYQPCRDNEPHRVEMGLEGEMWRYAAAVY